MSRILRSALREDIADYLDYKRALSRKFNNEEKALRLLDRFLFDQAVADIATIQPAMIEAFLSSRPRTCPRSYNHLLGVVRGLFDWLVVQGRLAASPVRARPRRAVKRLRPFLFEPAQFEQLLALAGQLRDTPGVRHRGAIYSLIFSLMYGLGLRVGEVVRLRYCDVDRLRSVLVIDKSKFGKTRLVPFGPQMARRISNYLQRGTDWYGSWHADDPLFAFRDPPRLPLRSQTVSQVFHRLITELALPVPPGVARPCSHCLRHSFAVTNLLRWYRSGVDPGRRLFHLSTFMGHADPSSTAWYLTITDALLSEANKRFERFATASREVPLP